MRKSLRVLVCAILLAIGASGLGAIPASADGGPGSSAIPPEELLRSAAKQQQLDARLAQNVITADYGEVIMSLWQEIQQPYAAKWCGPGSTEAVVGQWRGNAFIDNYSGPEGVGPDAYQRRLAQTLGEFDTFQQMTTWSGYTTTTNNEIGNGFYTSGSVGGFASYTDKLYYDIQWKGHPLAPVVDAYLLPGWNGHVSHFVTVKQYWIGGDTTTYGDTASYSQGRNSGANWTTMTLNGFYSAHIQPNNGYSSDQIVW